MFIQAHQNSLKSSDKLSNIIEIIYRQQIFLTQHLLIRLTHLKKQCLDIRQVQVRYYNSVSRDIFRHFDILTTFDDKIR